jgi:hypothetical protein
MSCDGDGALTPLWCRASDIQHYLEGRPGIHCRPMVGLLVPHTGEISQPTTNPATKLAQPNFGCLNDT